MLKKIPYTLQKKTEKNFKKREIFDMSVVSIFAESNENEDENFPIGYSNSTFNALDFHQRSY